MYALIEGLLHLRVRQCVLLVTVLGMQRLVPDVECSTLKSTPDSICDSSGHDGYSASSKIGEYWGGTGPMQCCNSAM